mmetsp:Transcript_34123/g.93806  ORF Transcript_34123/g.93806 Transcript_34123/m.93806 type:complete len:340 (-) Transcript_34123:3971-4990(-)
MRRTGAHGKIEHIRGATHIGARKHRVGLDHVDLGAAMHDDVRLPDELQVVGGREAELRVRHVARVAHNPIDPAGVALQKVALLARGEQPRLGRRGVLGADHAEDRIDARVLGKALDHERAKPAGRTGDEDRLDLLLARGREHLEGGLHGRRALFEWEHVGLDLRVEGRLQGRVVLRGQRLANASKRRLLEERCERHSKAQLLLDRRGELHKLQRTAKVEEVGRGVEAGQRQLERLAPDAGDRLEVRGERLDVVLRGAQRRQLGKAQGGVALRLARHRDGRLGEAVEAEGDHVVRQSLLEPVAQARLVFDLRGARLEVDRRLELRVLVGRADARDPHVAD